MTKRRVRPEVPYVMHNVKIISREGARITIQCACGALYQSTELRFWRTMPRQGCDCKKRKTLEDRNYKHGLSASKTYRTWAGIKARCSKNSVSRRDYKHYAGKGISVCDEWKEDYLRFLSDMGEAPSDKHEIDRIDNSQGYFKNNCRWATREEQMANTSSSVRHQIGDKLLTLREISNLYKIKYGTLRHRYYWDGYSVEEAISRGVQDLALGKVSSSVLGLNNFSLGEVCNQLQISRHAVTDRKRNLKITLEEALILTIKKHYGVLLGA